MKKFYNLGAGCSVELSMKKSFITSGSGCSGELSMEKD